MSNYRIDGTPATSLKLFTMKTFNIDDEIALDDSGILDKFASIPYFESIEGEENATIEA